MLTIEKWKPVPGISCYEVSNFGRVRRSFLSHNDHGVTPGRILVPYKVGPKKYGYLSVALWPGNGKSRVKVTVHRLVALAFIGPCPYGYEVNHKDANRLNNRLDNLEYLTHKENQKHAARLGKIKPPTLFGTNNPSAKLSVEQVLEIRSRIANKENIEELASKFNVGRSTIYRIKNNASWKSVCSL